MKIIALALIVFLSVNAAAFAASPHRSYGSSVRSARVYGNTARLYDASGNTLGHISGVRSSSGTRYFLRPTPLGSRSGIR